MADPILFAKRADLASFLSSYQAELTPFHISESTGQTVLFGALANRDPASWAAIANRLLDDGADTAVVTTSGITLLHALLGQRQHDPDLEGPLLRRLLEGGADINRIHSRDGAPLAMLYRIASLSHEQRLPMYQAFFSRPDLDLDARAATVHTVREIIAMAAHNQPLVQQLVDAYDAGRPAAQ